MIAYIYDIEILPNFASFTFIPANTSQTEVDHYIKADMDEREDDKQSILELIRYKKFIIYEGENEVIDLVTFLKSDVFLIGYNNHKYDDIIINYIISEQAKYSAKGFKQGKHITHDLYNLSQTLISLNEGLYMYLKSLSWFKSFKAPYKSLDLMKMLYLDKRRISLKKIAIALKWYRIEQYYMPRYDYEEAVPYINSKCKVIALYKIEYLDESFKSVAECIEKYEVRHYFDRFILKSNIKELIDYNINDVLITLELYKLKHDDVKLRVDISNRYGVNVLSESNTKIADKLVRKFYADYTGLEYYELPKFGTERRVIKFANIIDGKISFKSNELSNLLNRLKTINLKIGVDKFNETVLFKGNAYELGVGGIHSKDRPGDFKSTEDVELIDADVTSYYLYILRNLRIKPEHLSYEAFAGILYKLTEERVEAKAKSKTDPSYSIVAGTLKIIALSIFGKLGDEYSWLKDLLALYKTTVNGQLYLLSLIEDLELNDFKVLSCNTDGVTTKVPVKSRELYNNICLEWSKKYGFTLEYAKYNRYTRLNVNSYIAILDTGKVKLKNDFLTDIQIDKGYDKPIIKIALYDYFVNNIPIRDTILNHDKKHGAKAIYDFCMTQNVGGQFEVQNHSIVSDVHIIEMIQPISRFYVSNSGKVLLKKYKTKSKQISMVAGRNTTIMNDFIIYDNFEDYDINYNYYIADAQKTIDIILGNVPKVNESGRMFDDL